MGGKRFKQSNQAAREQFLRTRGGRAPKGYPGRRQRRRGRSPHRDTEPRASRIFLKGSSMVGSTIGTKKRGTKLLLFRPTKEMQKKGFLPMDLRFLTVKQAIIQDIDFQVTPRQDFITEMKLDLKKLDLL